MWDFFVTKITTFNIVIKPVSSFDGWEDKILRRDNCDQYVYFL